jgi:hypothetical protein
MADQFEEQYMAVLQNIEFGLVSAYHEHPKMTDFGALYVIETLIKAYNAELQGRTFSLPQFQVHEQAAYDRAKSICDWRLGRPGLLDEADKEVDVIDDPNTPEEIIACLKRIKKSIEFWQKRGGRRAYFDYVSQFVK